MASPYQLRRDAPKACSMISMLAKLIFESDGQDLIEYAMLAATIALGVIAAMLLVRDSLNAQFSSIGNSISAGS